MSATVITCVGCVRCGAVCQKCLVSRSVAPSPVTAGIRLCPLVAPPLAALAGKDGKRVLEEPQGGDATSHRRVVALHKRKKDDRSSAQPSVASVVVLPSINSVLPPACLARLRPVMNGIGVAVGGDRCETDARKSSPPQCLSSVGAHTCPGADWKEPSQEPKPPVAVVSDNMAIQSSEADPASSTDVIDVPTGGQYNGRGYDHVSDSDNYTDVDQCSDVSDLSDSDDEDQDDSGKMSAFADGDDSASEFEDDRSVVSGMTVASTGSLTPSLVGETLGFITLGDWSAHSPSALSAAHGAPAPAPPGFSLSQFPHVPPAINFGTYEEKCDELPAVLRKLQRWRLSTITPLLVRQTLINSGFKLTRQTPNWLGTWGKHMKSECFKSVRDFQKINHFPGTFQIGRKDKLWRNISALQLKFGKNDFGFVPRTYVLPTDLKALKMAWRRDNGKRKWIIKPPASARGAGIRVIQRWSELPKKKQLVVQRYVSRPYLIDERKFDLRLYVLVTSFSPLRVYIYEDGLVRFASVKYSNVGGKSLSDRFMHLTNYSINKNSQCYEPNEHAQLCQGHKWTLRAFWTYMRQRAVDTDALWRRIVDMVLKTLVSAEHHVIALVKQHVVSHYCCHELFGFDVLLDEKLRPWLLEVNISPSLHSTAAVDLSVKAPMLRDLLNMAAYHVPNKLPAEQLSQLQASIEAADQSERRTDVEDQSAATADEQGDQSVAAVAPPSRLVLDKRLYTNVLSVLERSKHIQYCGVERSQYLDGILESLTSDDVRHLIRAEDEFSRRGGFIRLFPTAGSHQYHPYFQQPRYYNQLHDAWESRYAHDRAAGVQLLRHLCQLQRHLSVPRNYLRRKTFTPEVIARAESLRKAGLLIATSISTPANNNNNNSASVKTSGSGAAVASRTCSSDSGVGGLESSSVRSLPRPRVVSSIRPAYKSLAALRRPARVPPPAVPSACPAPTAAAAST